MERLRETSLDSNDRRPRFSLRALLVAVAVVALILAFIGRELQKAMLEQSAYRKLVALGASGDDWIGPRELLLDREYSPIVHIYIPPSIGLKKALPLLSHLDNLEHLSIGSHSINESEFKRLSQLETVTFLDLSSTNLTDEDVPHLAQFTRLQWLDLSNNRLSDEGFLLLGQRLPDCEIIR